jgi:hypothetical protein
MAKKILDTIVLDGMYMDIGSIEFEYDKKLSELVNKCRTILEENPFLLSVSIRLREVEGLNSNRFFDSDADDEDKTENVDSRIDTEILKVYSSQLYYVGYSKWTSDYLEVDLEPILEEI